MKKPVFLLEEFKADKAIELYYSEQKRKQYFPKLYIILGLGLPIELALAVLIYQFNDKTYGFLLALIMLVVLFSAVFSAIYFWNRYRLYFKKHVLGALSQMYFPQTQFTYKKELSPDYASNIGIWDYHRLSIQAHDFIEGEVAALQVQLFEAFVQYLDKSDLNSKWTKAFQGIIMRIAPLSSIDIDALSASVQFKALKAKCLEHFDSDDLILTKGEDNSLFLLLKSSYNYFEPKSQQSVYNEAEMQRLVEDFYYLLSFTTVVAEYNSKTLD